jgi:hypothetical protein
VLPAGLPQRPLLLPVGLPQPPLLLLLLLAPLRTSQWWCC